MAYFGRKDKKPGSTPGANTGVTPGGQHVARGELTAERVGFIARPDRPARAGRAFRNVRAARKAR